MRVVEQADTFTLRYIDVNQILLHLLIRKHLIDIRDTLHVKRIVEHAEHMESIRKGTGTSNSPFRP